jgi:hypothetical protein
MIIDDLDIDWAGRAFRPLETNPPLVIDADAILTLPIAPQPFQAITGQCGEVFQTRRGVEPVQTYFSLPGEPGEFPNMAAFGKALASLVPVTHDHGDQFSGNYVLRKA